MRDDIEKFKQQNATIAVVVRDSAENVADYWKKEKLPYLGLPDPDGNLGELYGQQWKLFKLGLMPAMFIVAKDGTVVFKHFSGSMSDIPKNTKVLEVLQGLK